VVFKCGPFIGHQGVKEFSYDPGGGHVHPDANHFVVFGGGQWLIRDDGYRAKWAGQHNTLLVDGKGQLGEGKMWFNGAETLAAKARPRVVLARSTPALDHMVGDATTAYRREAGLTRFRRHLLFVKPGVLIVADDIALERAADLELRFHPEVARATQEGNAFTLDGKRARLRVDALTPEGVTLSAEALTAETRQGGKTDAMFTIRMTSHGARWRNAVAISWAAAGEAPPRVTVRTEGEALTFAAGERRVKLDWATGEAAEVTAGGGR